MTSTKRVTTDKLARELAHKLQLSEERARELMDGMCACLRDHLRVGEAVEVGDLFTLSVSGGAEIREDESGGFSAYAPTQKELEVRPIGTLKVDLERACNAAIYYISHGGAQFTDLLSHHFGRRGWQLIHKRNGMEVQSRLDRQPPVAVIFESHTEGWQELVRELKCNPRTNWVPILGIFPEETDTDPVQAITVQPDDVIHEPFDFSDFIRTAGSELASRVMSAQHDVTELQIHMPGTERNRREVRLMVEEILFRSGLPERFNRDAGGALAEALDNAWRHGHQFVDCCTIAVRVILDPRRLLMAVRDSGHGFDHAAVLTAARGRRTRRGKALAKAADALRTRHGSAREGGIARMFSLVERVEFNRRGNEVVLTKNLPAPESDA